MNRLHDLLQKSLNWYRVWHGSQFHGVVHWIAFLAIAVVVTVSFTTTAEELASTEYAIDYDRVVDQFDAPAH